MTNRSFDESRLIADANHQRYRRDFPGEPERAESLRVALEKISAEREAYVVERRVINGKYSSLVAPARRAEHASNTLQRLQSAQSSSDLAFEKQIKALRQEASENPVEVSETARFRSEDQLRRLDEIERMNAYISAIQNGDADIVAAVKRQSKTFPLISDLDWIAQQDERLLEVDNASISSKIRSLQAWQRAWDMAMRSFIAEVRNDLPDSDVQNMELVG